MKLNASHSPIFQIHGSGKVENIGSNSTFTSVASSPYTEIKQRALSLKALLESHSLNIGRSPTLNRLIESTCELSDAWDQGRTDDLTIEHLFRALQTERIASAALCQGHQSMPKHILGELLDGSIDLLGRHRSKAKDSLWELELLRTLADHRIEVEIAEPDLVVSFQGVRVGVACKKVYSEGNFSKVLSNAIGQIERETDFGIVALNIDDLLPENAILVAPTIDAMSATLAARNDDFLRRHERHLRKYLTPGRAISVLVSCAAIADVSGANPRYLNARQTTLWHIPGIPNEKAEQMNNFFEAMNSRYPVCD